MKTALFSALIGALLLGAPSDAKDSGSIDLGIQLEQTVVQLQEAYEGSQPTKPYFVELSALADQWTDMDEVMRKRLQRAISDLMARAELAKLRTIEMLRLRAMVIDVRLDRDLRMLWKQALAREATREDFQRMVDLLNHRAKAAMQPDDITQRLNTALDNLMKKAQGGGTLTVLEMSGFQDEMVKARLDRALAWLEEMALERDATREQFLYVKDLMTDRARIWQEDIEFQNAVNHVLRQLDELMARGVEGGLDRADLQRLRDSCMCRARGAVTSSTG
jgi:hypothetical protein